ncbi:synaptic vesicle glycoprotein 2B-like isoform X2 [Lycorma delicatula]
MSFALPSATCELQLTDFDKGCLNAAIFAGMITSAFLWGFLSDTFGRQRLLTIGYTLDSIFGIASSLSQTFWPILIFKFLSGVAICGPFSIFVAYLSELFNGKYRDRVIMSTGIFTSIGGIIQPIIAWYLIPKHIVYEFFDGKMKINSWRIFTLLSTLPSIMAAILTAFCVESPKFLMSQGRKEEALKVFRRIYEINTGKPADTYPVKKLRDERRKSAIAKQTEFAQSGQNKTIIVIKSFWRQMTALFKRPHVGNAAYVFSIQFFALLSMNTLRLWLPDLYYKIEEMPDATNNIVCEIATSNATKQATNCDQITVDAGVYTKLIYAAIVTTVCFIGGSYIIDIIGKEVFLLLGFLVAGGCGWVFSWCNGKWAIHVSAIYVAVLQANTVAMLGVVVQLFPTNLRTMAVSLTMMFGRLGVLFGSLAFSFVLELSCWAPFVGVGTITFCSAIAMIPLLPWVKKIEDEGTDQ